MRLIAYLLWESLKPFRDYIFVGVLGGLTLMPWIKALAETLWGDPEFIASMAIVVTANALLAFAVAWKQSTVRWKPFVLALGLAAAFLLTLAITHQVSKTSVFLSWVDAAFYAGIMCIELLRCIESLAHLGIVIPAFIRKRLQSFADDGTPLAAPSAPSETQPTA